MDTEKPTFLSNNDQEGMFKSSTENDPPIEEQQVIEQEQKEVDPPTKRTERYYTSSIAPAQRTIYRKSETYPLSRGLTQVIYYLASVLVLVLGIRFLLQLVGALNLGFARFIYQISDPFVSPFRFIPGSGTLTSSGRFAVETLLAILAIVVVAYLLVGLVKILGTMFDEDL